MLLPDLPNQAYCDVIRHYCGDFLDQSNGNPLFKDLSPTYGTFSKVKIRQKLPNMVGRCFNEALHHVKPNIADTSMLASTVGGSYFVFPINGFKHLFCPQISASKIEYSSAYLELLELFGKDHQKTADTLKEVIARSYTSAPLIEALQIKCEVMVYGIPWFFAYKTQNIHYGDLYKRCHS